MTRSAHSSTIAGSSPALKWRCDTGDQSAALSPRRRRTLTNITFHKFRDKREEEKEEVGREQMSVCTVSCQVGPEQEQGQPQTQGPKCLQGHSPHEPEWWQQSHVLPAGMHW
ncbi:unnamed protein product [Pleuronectes platessa]|uniref:Uncharacterized protein n=1 Tax=Pleuronectes platessa TaxID=8262 RepID=A0A9N7Z1J9_PLEPL|nr:unnamed protein product [Pleuronectes platessa]